MHSRYQWKHLRGLLGIVATFSACAYEPPTVEPNGTEASSGASSGNGGAGGRTDVSSGNGGAVSTGGAGGETPSSSSSSGEAGSGGGNSGPKAVIADCGGKECVITGTAACCSAGPIQDCNTSGFCAGAKKVRCDDRADCGALYCCDLPVLANAIECRPSCPTGDTVCKTNYDCVSGTICNGNRCK